MVSILYRMPLNEILIAGKNMKDFFIYQTLNCKLSFVLCDVKKNRTMSDKETYNPFLLTINVFFFV